MKSTLQNTCLALLLALVAACDSGSDGQVTDTGDDIAAPSNGVTGRALSGGPVSGAAVTVLDASGGNVEIASGSTTGDSGTYQVVFSERAVSAGITPPLTIRVSGGNTVCTLDRPDTAEDCFINGAFLAYGDALTLASEFTMSVIVPEIPEDTTTSDPVALANVSPATTLATALAAASAAGTAYTEDEVILAHQQVLALMRFLTSIEISDSELWALNLFNVLDIDPDDAASATDGTFVTMAFASAIYGEVNPNDASADTLGEALARLVAQFQAADGSIAATGNNFARLARSMALGMSTVDEALLAAGIDRPLIRAGAINASANATLFSSFGNNTVRTPPIADDDDANLAATREFVATLSGIINSGIAITGAAGFGGSRLGASEVFSGELGALGILSEVEATIALDTAIATILGAAAALEPGDTDVDLSTFGDGSVAGLVSRSADGTRVTVTDVAVTGTTIELLIGSGSRDEGGTFQIGEISLEDAAESTTFTGEGTIELAAGGESEEVMSRFDVTGSVIVAGDAFDLAFSASNLTRSTTGEPPVTAIDGNFSATFTLADPAVSELNVTFEGPVGAAFESFTFEVGGDTLMGTLMQQGATIVDVLTDGTVYLTLTRTGETLPSGVFTVGSGSAAVETATLDDNGVVTYSDGAIETLPAAVF